MILLGAFGSEKLSQDICSSLVRSSDTDKDFNKVTGKRSKGIAVMQITPVLRGARLRWP